MHPLRNQAIALRKAGRSYRNIEAELGIAKGTLSYMLRHIPISAIHRKRLQKRCDDNRHLFIAKAQALPKKEQFARRRRGGLTCWNKHRETCLKNLRAGFALSLLTYRKDEFPVKKALEKRYKVGFKKEVVLGQAVDFVTSELLIEHSRDGSKGLQDIMVRFEKLISDPRRKIAYIETAGLGNKRRTRLAAVVDEILDYRTLA